MNLRPLTILILTLLLTLPTAAQAEVTVIKCVEAIGSLRYNFVVDPVSKNVIEPLGAAFSYVDKRMENFDTFSLVMAGRGKYDAIYEFNRAKKRMDLFLIDKRNASDSPAPIAYGCTFEDIQFDPMETHAPPKADDKNKDKTKPKPQ